MIVNIDDITRIVGTELSWDLQVLHTPGKDSKSVPSWKAKKYFTSLSQALSGACEREIRLAPADTLEGCIECLQEIGARYKELGEVYCAQTGRATK